ncbi:MAG: TIGR00730 family Rossman fold protein [Chlamydiales bacterium]|nr:TIGR00730 family Rossman fold protein [Chlamydiales bacterium]
MPDVKLQLDSWRIFRIVSEFVDGFETMVSVGPSVSIFGSARIDPSHPYYSVTRNLAEKISKKGIGIITGGGPGVMAAANEGAQKGGAPSCGIAINLPYEETHNPFIDKKYLLNLRYYFVRKVMFVRYAMACIFMPGGFGTLDELFETLTLIQTKKVKPFPIFLVGKEHWSGLLDWLRKTPTPAGYLTPEDFNLFTCTDDLDFITQKIDEHAQEARATPTFDLGQDS